MFTVIALVTGTAVAPSALPPRFIPALSTAPLAAWTCPWILVFAAVYPAMMRG